MILLKKRLQGPIWKQVMDALDYIKNTVIEQKVEKIQGQAEAVRFYNYPYNALEEALVNAVFHKSYREAEPVEIRIYVDSIEILNYPDLPNGLILIILKREKLEAENIVIEELENYSKK